MEVARLRKELVWGWCTVKDKEAKDLAPAYCHHTEPSLMLDPPTVACPSPHTHIHTHT